MDYRPAYHSLTFDYNITGRIPACLDAVYGVPRPPSEYESMRELDV